jgi:hypothetical protein
MAARKPRVLIAFPLANEMGRTIWAVPTKSEDYRDPALVSAASMTCGKICLRLDEGCEKATTRMSKMIEHIWSEKPVQDSDRYSSPLRFGSDLRITIPASGFAKASYSEALQRTAFDHSHRRIKNLLHYGWQPQKSRV